MRVEDQYLISVVEVALTKCLSSSVNHQDSLGLVFGVVLPIPQVLHLKADTHLLRFHHFQVRQLRQQKLIQLLSPLNSAKFLRHFRLLRGQVHSLRHPFRP